MCPHKATFHWILVSDISGYKCISSLIVYLFIALFIAINFEQVEVQSIMMTSVILIYLFV